MANNYLSILAKLTILAGVVYYTKPWDIQIHNPQIREEAPSEEREKQTDREFANEFRSITPSLSAQFQDAFDNFNLNGQNESIYQGPPKTLSERFMYSYTNGPQMPIPSEAIECLQRMMH